MNSPRVVTLCGLPGVGKTTLFTNLRASIKDRRVRFTSEHDPPLIYETNALRTSEGPLADAAGALAYALAEHRAALEARRSHARVIVRDRGLEDTLYYQRLLVHAGRLPPSYASLLDDPDLLHSDVVLYLHVGEIERHRRNDARPEPAAHREARRLYEEFAAAGYEATILSHPGSIRLETAGMTAGDVHTAARAVLAEELCG